MERSLLYAGGSLLQPEDIRLDHAPKRLVPGNGNGQSQPGTGGNGAGTGGSEFLPEGVSLDEHEQNLIREALRRAGGNKSQAARMLGLTRNALRYRLSQMGLE